jgi:D-glycero-alpha-D-manno-heptose-7-phosphate kinase
MNVLQETAGKQDPYMAAFGGFRVLEIDRNGTVDVQDVPVGFMTVNELIRKARMYYTGVQRSATSVLRNQDEAARKKASKDHARVVDCLEHIKAIGRKIRTAFEEGDLDTFGRLMDEHWAFKKQMSERITLSVMDELYEKVKKDFGVLGGKIIGAGGGGFFMLYCPEKARELDAFMAEHEMPRVNYFPALQGAKVVADMTTVDDFDFQGA